MSQNLSPEDGWVDAQTIRNVFQHTMRRLDELLPSSQRLPVKDLVTELVESAKYALLKHRKTLEELQGARTQVKTEAAPSQKEAHEKRLQTLRQRQ